MTDAALMTTREHEQTQYIKCYAIGHAWFEYNNSDWRPEWGEGFVLRCERCSTERRDVTDRTGKLSTRSYRHPEGYKYAKGSKPTKDEFRRLMMEIQRMERESS